MRVAIIDDDEIDRLNLNTLLEAHEEVERAGEAATLEEAVKLMDREKPDAVFLDIHLGRQKGFKVLEKAAHRPLVVITTSHPHYALQGFEVEAVDYLLKPVMEETLSRALDRLKSRLAAVEPSDREPQLEADDMQMFRDEQGLHLVPVEHIQAILGERVHTRVLVADGRTFQHNRPLREWRRILPERLFKPLDRSTIVNLREVLSIHPDSEASGHRLRFRGSPHTVSVGEVALKTLRELG